MCNDCNNLGELTFKTRVVILKDLMPITFSSPRVQPEVVYFLISNESPYFSNCKSKISASISVQFWRYRPNKKCEVQWYTRK